MRRVLLLGGTGFIGSRVLDALRRRDGVRVMMLGHRRIPYRQLEGVDLVTGTLPAFDLEWLERFRPDTIIHSARLGGRGRLGRRLAARRGERANQRLVEWLTRKAPETHVVYVSGTLVYGDRGEEPTDEDAPIAPMAYAREYIRAERPWMEARRSGRLPVTIVRPPWVVGPDSWLRYCYLEPARRDGAVPLYGSGRNWMTFVDVEDCGGVIAYLAGLRRPGSVFNVFTPEQRARQEEFVTELASRMGVGVRPVPKGRLGLRDPAPMEALTTSFVAATKHDDLERFSFTATSWKAMLDRYAGAH